MGKGWSLNRAEGGGGLLELWHLARAGAVAVAGVYGPVWLHSQGRHSGAEWFRRACWMHNAAMILKLIGWVFGALAPFL